MKNLRLFEIIIVLIVGEIILCVKICSGAMTLFYVALLLMNLFLHLLCHFSTRNKKSPGCPGLFCCG